MISGPTWTGQAADIARSAAERAEAFYLLHAQEKRLQAAEDGLAQLDSLQDSASHPLHGAVQVTRAVATTVDGDARLTVEKTALIAIAEKASAMAAGTTALASLALQLLPHVPPAQRPQAAEAAFKALPADEWTSFIATLPHTHGEKRLQLSATAAGGDPAARCRHASQAASNAAPEDALEIARHLLDQMPANDPTVALLRHVAGLATVPAGVLEAGFDAVGRGADLRATARALAKAGDAQVDRLALACLPRNERLDKAFSTLRCSDHERLEAALTFAETEKILDLKALGRIGVRLLDEAGDERRAELPHLLLTEASTLAAELDDGAASRCLDVVGDALRLDLASPEQSQALAESAARLLAEDVPRDLPAAAARVRQLLDPLEAPEDCLQVLGVMASSMKELAKTPEENAMVSFIVDVARAEPYEASTVWRALTVALTQLSEPEEDTTLPLYFHSTISKLNYWVDQEMAGRLAMQAIHGDAIRRGDPGMADCATFVQKADAIDVSDEKERANMYVRALGWMADNPSPGRASAALGELASALREDTESHMRDIHVGGAAARVMADVAKRDHDGQLAAEAELLVLLADRKAENVAERLTGLYAAMETQRTSELDGIQRLAAMGCEAAAAHQQSCHDRALIGRSALEIGAKSARSRGDTAQAEALDELREWASVRLYGDKSGAVAAQLILEAVQDTPRVTPGVMAQAAKGILEEVPGENERLLVPRFLASIERIARRMGDTAYVPELLAAHREAMEKAPDEDTRRERLHACLEELSRFQGEAFDQALAASRLRSEPNETGRIEQADGEVVIGGIRVPVR